jgi:hypothetical protein
MIKTEPRELERKAFKKAIRYTAFTYDVGLVNRLFEKQVTPYPDRTPDCSYFIRLYEPQAQIVISSENKLIFSYLKNERGVNGECHFSISCFDIFFKIVQNGLPTVTLHFNRIGPFCFKGCSHFSSCIIVFGEHNLYFSSI